MVRDPGLQPVPSVLQTGRRIIQRAQWSRPFLRAGHNADMSRHGICNMLKSTFNTSHRNFDAECPNYVGSLIRKARGLALQHTPE